MKDTRVSIIIPAYNEADVIGDVVSKTKTLYPDFEIIVIDDGSSDETAVIAGEAGATYAVWFARMHSSISTITPPGVEA